MIPNAPRMTLTEQEEELDDSSFKKCQISQAVLHSLNDFNTSVSIDVTLVITVPSISSPPH
jgi:hypothetical protein